MYARSRLVAAVVALVGVVAACGGAGPASSPRPSVSASAARTTPALPASPSPSPAPSASGVPTPSPTAAPRPVPAPGAPAYVAVSVATLWRSPSVVRRVDAPALANPARIEEWLSAMSDADREGLIDRADSQLLLGERVLVLAVRNAWAQVVVPDQGTPLDARGYPGWIPLVQLDAVAPVAADSVATVVVRTTRLTPSTPGASLMLSFGTTLPVLAVAAGAVEVGLPGGLRGRLSASAVVVHHRDTPALPATAAATLATARLFLGIPYLWAGTSGFGFDCSGLMYAVHRVHGLLLPRDAAPQAQVGVPVARSALRPGDLVFFGDGEIHHVAMYAGGGMILESPHTGASVRLVALQSEPYASEYAGARRVLP